MRFLFKSFQGCCVVDDSAALSLAIFTSNDLFDFRMQLFMQFSNNILSKIFQHFDLLVCKIISPSKTRHLIRKSHALTHLCQHLAKCLQKIAPVNASSAKRFKESLL